MKHNTPQDELLQERIDHEIRMRDGTAKLLTAAKHPQQMLEAAKTLLVTNARIISYMSQLQRSKTTQALSASSNGCNSGNLATGREEQNQTPCTAKLAISNIRIPLMWRDVDHFKNKGDHRRYAVFCLLRVGSKIYDTSLIKDVDRTHTDITFDDNIIFEDVSPDFQCTFEVYSHRLVDDLTIASTPRRIRKRINEISNSVGRSMGKRLSGLKDDTEFMANMLVGPKFEMIAKAELSLRDVDNAVNTFELSTKDCAASELALFGHFCCCLAAQPDCMVNPTTVGNLYIKCPHYGSYVLYWCILKSLRLNCWLKETDVDCAAPVCSIPVTKDTQIGMLGGAQCGDKDYCVQLTVPSTTNTDSGSETTSNCNHSTDTPLEATRRDVSDALTQTYVLAMDCEEEQTQWWNGLQQHMLDQALWQHACSKEMRMKSFTPNRRSLYLATSAAKPPASNLYDEIQWKDSPVRLSSSPDSPLPIADMDESPVRQFSKSRSVTSTTSTNSSSGQSSVSSLSEMTSSVSLNSEDVVMLAASLSSTASAKDSAKTNNSVKADEVVTNVPSDDSVDDKVDTDNVEEVDVEPALVDECFLEQENPGYRSRSSSDASVSSVKSAASVKSSNSIKSVGSVDSIESTSSVKSSASIESVKSSASTRSTGSAKSVGSTHSNKSTTSLKSNKSTASVASNDSIKSSASNHSVKSTASLHSNHSVKSSTSLNSNRSAHSNASLHSSKSASSVNSATSHHSTHSARSDHSTTSVNSQHSVNSTHSNRSNHSTKSNHSASSNHSAVSNHSSHSNHSTKSNHSAQGNADAMLVHLQSTHTNSHMQTEV